MSHSRAWSYLAGDGVSLNDFEQTNDGVIFMLYSMGGQPFSAKRLTVNILDFVDPLVPITNTQLCC